MILGVQHLADHLERQALKQRDALAQRRLEFDLAAHRPLGDRGDMVLQPDEAGEFVDAFLADHGRIHVGEKKLLAPGRGRLHHDVDRQIVAGGAEPVGEHQGIFGAGKEDVGGDLVVQPDRFVGLGSTARAPRSRSNPARDCSDCR